MHLHLIHCLCFEQSSSSCPPFIAFSPSNSSSSLQLVVLQPSNLQENRPLQTYTSERLQTCSCSPETRCSPENDTTCRQTSWASPAWPWARLLSLPRPQVWLTHSFSPLASFPPPAPPVQGQQSESAKNTGRGQRPRVLFKVRGGGEREARRRGRTIEERQ